MIFKSAGLLLTRPFLLTLNIAKMSTKKLEGKVAVVTASTDGYYTFLSV